MKSQWGGAAERRSVMWRDQSHQNSQSGSPLPSSPPAGSLHHPGSQSLWLWREAWWHRKDNVALFSGLCSAKVDGWARMRKHDLTDYTIFHQESIKGKAAYTVDSMNSSIHSKTRCSCWHKRTLYWIIFRSYFHPRVEQQHISSRRTNATT